MQPVRPSCSAFAFPSFFTNFEFLMCPFLTIPFFAWHHTENCFSFVSNTIEATCLYFRSKQNSAPSAMQIMALFHLTLNPWQQSCLDHAARTGTRAMAVSVLHAQASAMQQQTLKISLELPGAHSLGLFFAIKFHHKNICKTRIPSAVRATHCGKLHV